MSNFAGENNGTEDMDLGNRGIDNPDAVRARLGQFDFGNLFEGLGAFDLSDGDDGIEVGDLASEGDLQSASAFDEESALSALRNLSVAPKRKFKKARELKTFTEEDFEEGRPRFAFRVIQANVNCLFDRKSSQDEIQMATNYIYGAHRNEYSFEDCCALLGARKNVMRLRLNYEFWRQWIVFPEDFGFFVETVPEELEGRIYFLTGDEGYDLARLAWNRPGIHTSELLSQVATEATIDVYSKALESLSSNYIMSERGGCWYLTGRNPALLSLDLATAPYRPGIKHMSWSKLF